MTNDQKRQLATCLEEWLTDIDQHAKCSDGFFRAVYSARVQGFRATGLLESLKEEIAEGEAEASAETKTTKARKRAGNGE